ncbi:MAG: glutathione S-transferase family protein [Hyphomicrobiales bacterium]|nr:MAG: glutathione S-transferase family protein [Hyphomicrobiales bacterium]
MPQFIVHTVPGSPFARSVLATLIEKSERFSIAPIAPGTTKSEAFLKLHPFGRMPVLQHGDFVLYETQAILRYLDRVLPKPALTPSDAKAAARMDQLMNICDWYLFQGVCNVIVFHRVVGPKLMGLAPDEAAIAAAMPKARTVIAELDRLLGDKPWLAGDHLSLADLHVAPQLDFLAQTPEWTELSAPVPRLAAWLSRSNARDSMTATTWERVAALAQAA